MCGCGRVRYCSSSSVIMETMYALRSDRGSRCDEMLAVRPSSSWPGMTIRPRSRGHPGVSLRVSETPGQGALGSSREAASGTVSCCSPAVSIAVATRWPARIGAVDVGCCRDAEVGGQAAPAWLCLPLRGISPAPGHAPRSGARSRSAEELARVRRRAYEAAGATRGAGRGWRPARGAAGRSADGLGLPGRLRSARPAWVRASRSARPTPARLRTGGSGLRARS
jgi:hypothetical protein